MIKILTLIITLNLYSLANLTGSSFNQRDINLLEQLDIDPSFITNYELHKVYEQYQIEKNSKYYLTKFQNATTLMPRVKEILKEEGLPEIFIYLAMAESYFMIEAQSHANAVGLWQFIKPTAKVNGLEIDFYIDERLDFVKSTKAASKHLKSLYSRLDRWYLAAIAYNCGEARVIEGITRALIDKFVAKDPKREKTKQVRNYRNIIKKYQDGKVKYQTLKSLHDEIINLGIDYDLDDLLRYQKGLSRQYLPKESRNYIRKIVTLAMLNSHNFVSNSDEYHLLNIGVSNSIATVKVKGGWHLSNVAKAIGMSYNDLHELNKHLKMGIIPPNKSEYEINIPYDKLNRFNLVKDEIQGSRFAVYKVKSGDNLLYISRKFNIPVKLIQKQNNLRGSFLRVNQELLLPISKEMLNEKTKKVASVKNAKKVALTKK